MIYSIYRKPFVRKRWLKLEYLSSQTLPPSTKNFSSDWFLPHCEKSRKMFLNATGTNPFKTNQQIRWRNQISKSKAARSNKKFSKRCIPGNCYALVTKCVRDVQNMRNFSNNGHVTMLYSFLRWRRFNTSTFQCVKKVYAAHISASFPLPPFRSSGQL